MTLPVRPEPFDKLRAGLSKRSSFEDFRSCFDKLSMNGL